MDSELYECLIKDFVKKDNTEEILFRKLVDEMEHILSIRLRKTRRGPYNLTEKEQSEAILAGLSTVLWYITIIARNRGSSLDKIMLNNYYDLERQESNSKAKSKLKWRNIT